MIDELSDEEKSYHAWIDNNLSFISQNKHILHLIQKAYMDGFAAGFTYKQQLSAKEYLQK
jgi:hypothetical protein